MFTGLRDRFVGKALNLMHERPAQFWTVDELASEVAFSRAFKRMVGLPPAKWRRSQVGNR